MAGLLTLHTVFLHLLHLSDGFSEVRCEAQPILEAGGIEDDEDFALPTRYCRQQLDPKLVICGEGEGQKFFQKRIWNSCLEEFNRKSRGIKRLFLQQNDI